MKKTALIALFVYALTLAGLPSVQARGRHFESSFSGRTSFSRSTSKFSARKFQRREKLRHPNFSTELSARSRFNSAQDSFNRNSGNFDTRESQADRKPSSFNQISNQFRRRGNPTSNIRIKFHNPDFSEFNVN